MLFGVEPEGVRGPRSDFIPPPREGVRGEPRLGTGPARPAIPPSGGDVPRAVGYPMLAAFMGMDAKAMG